MTGASSARVSILRADVMEMTRATRCMRLLVHGGPIPSVRKVPFRLRLKSALAFPGRPRRLQAS